MGDALKVSTSTILRWKGGRVGAKDRVLKLKRIVNSLKRDITKMRTKCDTPGAQELIDELKSRGLTVKRIAETAGYSVPYMYDWLKHGLAPANAIENLTKHLEQLRNDMDDKGASNGSNGTTVSHVADGKLSQRLDLSDINPHKKQRKITTDAPTAPAVPAKEEPTPEPVPEKTPTSDAVLYLVRLDGKEVYGPDLNETLTKLVHIYNNGKPCSATTAEHVLNMAEFAPLGCEAAQVQMQKATDILQVETTWTISTK